MARNSYKMTFRDSAVRYVLENTNHDDTTVPIKVLEEEQMEVINHMLLDIPEANFSCTEEEFYNRLTPTMLEWYREHRSNEFKPKPII